MSFTVILWMLCFGCIFCFPAHAQKDTTALKEYSPLPIGVAIGYYPMKNNPVYAGIVASQFDHVTFEYALKNGAIVRRDGKLDYRRADELVKLCRSKGLNIYGHTLCWYQNNSPYLATLAGDSAAIENFLQHYIKATVSRYKGVVYAWDVVNEAIDNQGKLRTSGKAGKDYFYWGRYLKQGYIARAFQYAHEADSSALLFYNDYDLERYPEKLQGVIALVQRLKQQHVPIDGIGTQLHISINTPNAGIDSAFKSLALTGLLVRISELDIKANPDNDSDFVFTAGIPQKQAEKCAYVLASYFKYVPARQRYGITFWNVGDGDSWIVLSQKRKDNPTLFDQHYKPKAMYYAVQNFFKHR
jgi:endo-1,4-beta-xylanase